MEPKVSVIVPVYNVEPFLARCLDSIVGQTLREIEIVCVDDGSPDRSIDILNRYAAQDSRIRVISQETAAWAEPVTGVSTLRRANTSFMWIPTTGSIRPIANAFMKPPGSRELILPVRRY